MSYVQKLVTAASFDATGVLVPAGHIGTFDTERLSGEEEHLKDVGNFQPAVVEIAPLGPTGPNPTVPQQLPNDGMQGPGGQYIAPGAVLVGEVTNPQEQRIDQRGLRDADREAEVRETLGSVMDSPNADRNAGGPGATTGNGDDALVAGTVAEITADLGTRTDDQLRQIQAAERDREKPRNGVLNAIQDELDARAARQ